jgi:hypothetical protein
MKTIKFILGLVLSASLLTSCYREEVIIADVNPTISVNQLLSAYELWYVDINATQGFGEVPFLQIAFTVSFRNGRLFANNNLVGFGSQGNGFGVDIGNYDAYNGVLDTYHILDGYDSFDVYQINANTIELYHPFSDTSYFLRGYQRNTFDYDFIFYDNIHYFLQEYEAWEKVYTSNYGVLNEFDYENYLQFLAGGNDSTFRSSQDSGLNNPLNIYWDYTGVYNVTNIPGNFYLKRLTLDYDFFDNEFFELSVINDGRIQLYHTISGTVYEFAGRGYIPYMRQTNVKGKTVTEDGKPKKRKQKTPKVDNPRTNTRS